MCFPYFCTVENKDQSISLNKYISSTGICSRREADKFIDAGKVTINGKKAVLGNRVFPRDIVKLNGKRVVNKTKPIYIAFNKPPGIVCTTDLKEAKNIISFINHKERLFPIGRLDKASQGLIFLTNDGDIVNKILRSGNKHEKEYIVRVDRKINKAFAQKMENGIPILGTITKKCTVEIIGPKSFKIILTQGLNRQIRRMCEYLGYEVKALKRTRIMHIHLGKLSTGRWRNLQAKEIAEIMRLTKHSKKTN